MYTVSQKKLCIFVSVKVKGYTLATTFLLRGHCNICTGCPRMSFLCFNRTATLRIQNTTPSVAFLRQETRQARRRLSACVRVRGAHFVDEL